MTGGEAGQWGEMKLVRHFGFITMQQSTAYYDMDLHFFTRSWAERGEEGDKGPNLPHAVRRSVPVCRPERASQHDPDSSDGRRGDFFPPRLAYKPRRR